MKYPITLAVIIYCIALSNASGQTIPSFQFVHVTAPAIDSRGDTQALRKLIAELNAAPTKPAFVVVTGDVTRSGKDEEFARFLKAVEGLSCPIYCAPGTRDVQRSPSGKEAFQRVFKKLYQSFDSNGCHFVILDSTILMDYRGHFEQAELKWLESDLRRLKRGTPVFVFCHHSVALMNPEFTSADRIDNEDDLLRALAPYNIVAMFSGHHAKGISWMDQGIHFFILPGTGSDGSNYFLADVNGRDVSVLARTVGESPRNVTIGTAPLYSGPRRRVAFGWDDINIPLLQRRQFLAELRADDKIVRDAAVRAEYSIDGGPFSLMVPDERINPGDKPAKEGRFMARFETKSLANGSHAIQIHIRAPDGMIFHRQETFQVEQVSGQPKREWTSASGEGIQSTPLLVDSILYVTSTDGKVYALDAKNGKKRWATATGGPIVASPVIADGALYVGSTDHRLYALDAKSGSVRWKYETPGPVFATAAVAQGVVCVGGNLKILGIDAQTGKERWTHPARSFFQSRTATDGSVFYLRDLDQNRYALDAASGAVRSSGTANYDPPPVMDRGRIVSGTVHGLFSWTDAASGKLITQYAIDPGHCFSSAAIGPKMAYMTSMNGRVFAISTP